MKNIFKDELTSIMVLKLIVMLLLIEIVVKSTSMPSHAEYSEADTATHYAGSPQMYYESEVAANEEDTVQEVEPAYLEEQESETSTAITDNSTTMYEQPEDLEDEGSSESTEITEYVYEGPVLNKYNGRIVGPSGQETYYNLDMSGCIQIMQSLGYDYEYWVRDDGVKMYGEYVMVGADLTIRPKGTILPSSLGMAIVVDTGDFTQCDQYQLDIAVAW